MKRKRLVAAVVIACSLSLALAATPVGAEDGWRQTTNPENFSATLTFATDYVFRGVSQTDNKPAVQGSFDYKHPIGVFAGLWGSNVDDYVSKGNVELDLYGGYGLEPLPGLNLQAALIYYYYPGSGSDPRKSYVEGRLGADYTFKALSLSPKISAGCNYSPDFFGEDGDGHYTSGRVDLSLPFEFTLYGLIGYQWVEGDQSSGKGAGENGNDGFDYTHWQVGLSRALLGFTLDLSYQDTDEAAFLGKDIADERLVFSVSRTF
ncbi:MAG: TorF family putative porin [Desulfobacterales bacterium]|jgi:uncharacterized protein (TIGR02001 family)|nr:TorF family putative porin [Desulfobacterales bacterium]